MNIYLVKEPNQEKQARCCAMFSRSHVPLSEQLNNSTNEQSSNFVQKYVSGYGHNSINDCGFVCFAIEGISMIAAKFIEDYPLFNGQESSTRYINFDRDNCISSFSGPDALKFLEFYRKAVPVQIDYVCHQNKIDFESSSKSTQNAVRAMAFDVVRGWLPAGCNTQIAWVTTFRQAVERIEMMLRHPLLEIQNIGKRLQEEGLENYPGAFDGLSSPSHIKTADDYYESNYWKSYYDEIPCNYTSISDGKWNLDYDLNKIVDMNPRHSSKHIYKNLNLACDPFRVQFPIDYGSWRDVHRHRNCIQNHPVLTNTQFHDFYLTYLSPDLHKEAVSLLRQIVNSPKCSDFNEMLNRQYSLPMGFQVPYRGIWSLSQLIYVLELRSKSTVHPTLRQVVHRIYDRTSGFLQDANIKVHIDKNNYPYTGQIVTERGNQNV